MPPDPYKYFRIEARELVDLLGKTVLDLERGPSPDLVARLLRAAHTLKGAARVVKQREIADRAHALEDALAPLRESSGPLSRRSIDSLLVLVDEMSARVSALDAAPGAVAPSPPLAAESAQDGVPPNRVPPEPARAVHADAAEIDELLDGVTGLHAQLAPARRALGTLERARRLAEVIASQLAAPPAPEERRGGAEQTRALAEELGALLANVERSLSSGVEQIGREMTVVRHAAEQIRLAPARGIFGALERTTRDAAQAFGRLVTFEASGGDVRLDAHVLGAVQGALVQVARNAVAHGFEPSAEREAAGKPRAGRFTIGVARRGRLVAFSGTDDGRGVDLEAVRGVALQRGLLSADGRGLATEELLGLLLRGGVTTSESVTEVAGRGVGLDVVRETAERLGGDVAIRTVRGRGTTVELTVPVSVASLLGLMVASGGVRATIPLDAVVRTLRIGRGDVARTAEGETVVQDGVAVPFLSLERALSSRDPAARDAPAWSAVVVRGAAGVAVVGVDRLLGTANVVLRPLPELALAAAVVAGASLDAEGNPQLVLDPDALVTAARERMAPTRPTAAPRAPILVIDDSLTTRMLERSILESAGYEVDVAISGEEGLEKARSKRYSLFLVDIEMPGIDGFTFVQRTRADVTLRDVPAILVSSRSSPEDLRRGKEVGAFAYMVKSEFDQGALLERIREQVG